MNRADFPKDFVWGSATASYQIEGAALEDGRKPSIWDTFSHTPGKVKNGDTGDVACDHYHRYPQDIALLKELGMDAYRFSIAWPRIIPEGRGPINAKGLEFYDRLVDGLLEAGITPWATLYHWDLPQALQNQGGWARRDTAHAFEAYADVVSRRLGDRVKNWITHNEPWCVAYLGNAAGIHAPGLQDYALSLQVAHHVLLSHGMAVPVIRQNSTGAKVGITLNVSPSYPVSDSPEDIAATRRHDGFFNRWYLDPLYGQGYPQDMWELYGKLVPKMALNDLEVMSASTDFLGINHYSRAVIRHNSQQPILQAEGVPVPENEYTYIGWEVFPQSLSDILVRIQQDYNPPALYITENGACYDDAISDDGNIHDIKRQRYFEAHLKAALESIRKGAKLKGYFAWSLMDNFEWAEGYDKRFGLVYVNFETQERRIKQSGRWFQGFLGQKVLV